MFSKLRPLKSPKKSRARALEKHLDQYRLVKNEVDLNDFALFRKEVAGIKKIECDLAQLNLPKPKPRLLNIEHTEPMISIFSELTDWLDLDCTEQLSWVKDGHDPNIIKRLQKGKCQINYTIDLHGQTIANASIDLQQVLEYMIERQERYLLIIHGKGNHFNSSGVIKAKVNQWLRQHSGVIAFASAPLKWGDTGAVVVMLKV